MADKIIFDTNVAQTIALKYADGKRVESRYHDYEVYYSTTDGRCFYATPTLDAKIQALEPAAGEEFEVCKREVREGAKKRVEWQVTRPADTAQEPERPTVKHAAPATSKSPERSNNTNSENAVSDKRSSDAIQPNTSMSQIMQGALIAAIDALAVARDYGVTRGFTLDFNEEDVRASAASIFIAATRDIERFRVNAAPSVQRVNGGIQ